MKKRKAIVAGKFYPANKDDIVQLLNSIIKSEEQKINYGLSSKNIIGGIVPHAGYMFSAYQAVHFFEIIKNSPIQYETVVIINPNHTGYGLEISLDDNDSWETPFGSVEIDKSFYSLLQFPISEQAQKFEHSGEVMLPMLQYTLKYDFKILPINILSQNFKNAKQIAINLFNANKILNKKLLIIASSDFCHYVDPELGIHLDNFVLNEIEKLDAEAINKVVEEKELSVCGFGSIMTLIEYSKLSTKNPVTKILRRGHSGEIIASKEVVDYVSILFYNE